MNWSWPARQPDDPINEINGKDLPEELPLRIIVTAQVFGSLSQSLGAYAINLGPFFPQFPTNAGSTTAS
jgi:hypothetical protein